jgi:NitT/TauT family transport system substrate-binding protein
MASTSKAIEALLGGSADVVTGGYDAAIQMGVEGKFIEAIAVFERWPPIALVVAPQSVSSIRTISDLKGQVVGVSSPGSSTHHLLNYLLMRNGLSPSDVTPVGVGASFSMAAAVRHGKVAAVMANTFALALLSKEFSPVVLADCRTQRGAEATLGTSDLPWVCLMVSAEWARSHAEMARKLGRAARRSLDWIQAHSPEEIAHSIPQEYKGEDPLVYLTAVRDIRPAFSTDGLMAPDGPANLQRFVGVFDKRARTQIDLSKTYTNEFIQSR